MNTNIRIQQKDCMFLKVQSAESLGFICSLFFCDLFSLILKKKTIEY
tara:strand:- start:1918 stop:2058 length:141 start_codon:yes stop_codon:yes gene_type:complete